ncbi:MAG TPA: MFS transporter, partial [Candidatus Bathyarchaeota archaeon]|nr:MFS transporter [Candidatus Bathyarchaeota archaeon]
LLAAYMLNLMGWRRALAILSTPAILLSLVLLFFVRGTSQVEAPSRDALNLSKLREQLRNRNVLAISVLRTAMAFRMGVRTFLPLYFIDVLGLSTAQSSLLYSVLLFGGVFGPFFWGSLSDRVNRRPLIIGIMVASGLGYLSLLWVKGFTALLVLLFLLGFMVQTVVVQSVLSDSVPRSQLDQVFGLYFTLGFTVASFSSIIFGYVVEYWGFHAGFVYIAAVTLVSMVPAFFIEEPRTWTHQPSTI